MTARRGWFRSSSRRLFTNRFAALALLCIAILALGMAFALSSLLARAVSDWEWENTAALVRREVEQEKLAPLLSQPPGPETAARLGPEIQRAFKGLPEVTRIKVWNRQATVLWSDESRLIGQSFPDNHELKEALEGKVEVEIKTLRRSENVYDPQGGRLAEIYVPILGADGTVVGVVEIYKTPVRLYATIRRGTLLIWGMSIAGGVVLYLVLLPLVREVYGRQLREEMLVEDAGRLEQEVARRTQDLREANARLLEADRLKSRFVASVSHELRTPLNAILGFTKVMLKDDSGLNAQHTGFVRAIQKSGTDLLQLVNTVLQAARLESGRLDMKLEIFDLQALIEECLDTARILAGGKSLVIEAEVAPDVVAAQGDRLAVRQILLNLLSNAVKFTPHGRVVVRARQEPGGLHLSVHDTGVGIREEDLGRIFRAFVRLEPAMDVDEGGSGLGLAVTRQLVELHGGRVWAESRQLSGSTFHVSLPQPPRA